VLKEVFIDKIIYKEIFVDKLVEVPIIKEKIIEKKVIDDIELNKQRFINQNLREEISKLIEANHKYQTDINNLRNEIDLVCSSPPEKEIIEKEVIVERPIIKEVKNINE
jgi:hypothetical protein